MPSKNANQTLDKAMIRCRKAQSFARPFTHKKKVKAGTIVQQKMVQLIQMTKEKDFGELTSELITLDIMIENMQKGVLEGLLESVETIERRMKSYQKTLLKEEELNGSTVISIDDIDDEAPTSLEKMYGTSNSQHSKEDTSCTAENTDGWNEIDDEVGSEITTVQQKRFMDRLRNFFSIGRVAEERVQVVDPQGKIASMKVRPHTRGGIKEKDGTYKSGYRQEDIEGKPIQHLSDLYVAAREASSAFRDVMDSLRQKCPELSSRDIEVAPIKQHSRAAMKAQEEFTFRQPGPAEAWLYDILRGSVYCKSYKQMNDVNKYLKENVHIVDCINRFAFPRFDGYRDILYYVSVPYDDELAFICEIQVHHIEFQKHYGVNSHRSHLRPYFTNTLRDPAQLLSDLHTLLQIGKVDENLMEFLLGASDPDQLKLFARIFFEEMGETKIALEVFERVLALEEAAFGEYDVRVGTTYVYLGRILLKLGEFDDALNCLRNAVTIFTDGFGLQHPQVAATLVIIAEVYSMQGDFNSALREQQSALETRRESLGQKHILVSESYVQVAKIQCDQGHFNEGMVTCNVALKIQESIADDNCAQAVQLHSTIGAIFGLQGEYQKAIKSYEKALTTQENIYGRKHQRIADTLTEIGNLKMKEKEFSEAEIYHQRALRVRETALGKHHPECAISHGRMGIIRCREGNYEEGLRVLGFALKLVMKSFGKYHLLTSNCFANIGLVMIENNDYDDAMNQYEACLEIQKKLLGKTHSKYAETSTVIGQIETMKGNFESAVTTLSKALIIFENVFGSNHPVVANTSESIGIAFEGELKHEQALDHHARALAIRNSSLGKQHPATISSCFAVANVLERKMDFVGARMAYGQALISCLSFYGEVHVNTARARLRLGGVLNHEKDFDNAIEELRKVISISEELGCTDDLQTAEACSLLGTVLSEQDEFEEALTLHERALEIRKLQLSADDPLVYESIEAVDRLTDSR